MIFVLYIYTRDTVTHCSNIRTRRRKASNFGNTNINSTAIQGIGYSFHRFDVRLTILYVAGVGGIMQLVTYAPQSGLMNFAKPIEGTRYSSHPARTKTCGSQLLSSERRGRLRIYQEQKSPSRLTYVREPVRTYICTWYNETREHGVGFAALSQLPAS